MFLPQEIIDHILLLSGFETAFKSGICSNFILRKALQNIDPDTCNEFIKNHNIPMIKQLVWNDKVDCFTPFSVVYASKRGYLDIVEILEKHNLGCKTNISAVDYAASNGHLSF